MPCSSGGKRSQLSSSASQTTERSSSRSSAQGAAAAAKWRLPKQHCTSAVAHANPTVGCPGLVGSCSTARGKAKAHAHGQVTSSSSSKHGATAPLCTVRVRLAARLSLRCPPRLTKSRSASLVLLYCNGGKKPGQQEVGRAWSQAGGSDGGLCVRCGSASARPHPP